MSEELLLEGGSELEATPVGGGAVVRNDTQRGNEHCQTTVGDGEGSHPPVPAAGPAELNVERHFEQDEFGGAGPDLAIEGASGPGGPERGGDDRMDLPRLRGCGRKKQRVLSKADAAAASVGPEGLPASGPGRPTAAP